MRKMIIIAVIIGVIFALVIGSKQFFLLKKEVGEMRQQTRDMLTFEMMERHLDNMDHQGWIQSKIKAVMEKERKKQERKEQDLAASDHPSGHSAAYGFYGQDPTFGAAANGVPLDFGPEHPSQPQYPYTTALPVQGRSIDGTQSGPMTNPFDGSAFSPAGFDSHKKAEQPVAQQWNRSSSVPEHPYGAALDQEHKRGDMPPGMYPGMFSAAGNDAGNMIAQPAAPAAPAQPAQPTQPSHPSQYPHWGGHSVHTGAFSDLAAAPLYPAAHYAHPQAQAVYAAYAAQMSHLTQAGNGNQSLGSSPDLWNGGFSGDFRQGQKKSREENRASPQRAQGDEWQRARMSGSYYSDGSSRKDAKKEPKREEEHEREHSSGDSALPLPTMGLQPNAGGGGSFMPQHVSR